MNTLRLGVRASKQFIDEANKVDLGSALGNRDDALPRLGLDSHKQVGRAVADVFVVLFGRGMGCHWQWLAAMTDELQTLLVNADHGLLATNRLGIQGQQVVHPISVLLRQRPDAPHQPTPWFEVVFFNIRRTVSRLTPLKPGSCLAARSSATIVQR